MTLRGFLRLERRLKRHFSLSWLDAELSRRESKLKPAEPQVKLPVDLRKSWDGFVDWPKRPSKGV